MFLQYSTAEAAGGRLGRVSIENVMSETTMRTKITVSNQRPTRVSE